MYCVKLDDVKVETLLDTPKLAVVFETQDFGMLLLEDSRAYDFTMANISGGNLEIVNDAITITGAGADQFALVLSDITFPLVLEGGAKDGIENHGSKVANHDTTFCEISNDGGIAWVILAQLLAAGEGFSYLLPEIKINGKYLFFLTKTYFSSVERKLNKYLEKHDSIDIASNPFGEQYLLPQNYKNEDIFAVFDYSSRIIRNNRIFSKGKEVSLTKVAEDIAKLEEINDSAGHYKRNYRTGGNND